MLQNALVSWFYPSQQISTTQLLAHSPQQCDEGRIGKVSKLMGWNKGNLKDKVQATYVIKAKQGPIYPFPWAGSSSISRKAGFHHKTWWLGETKVIISSSFFFPQLCMLSYMLWDIPLDSRGQPSQPCPLPSCYAPQPPRWWCGMRSRRDLYSV